MQHWLSTVLSAVISMYDDKTTCRPCPQEDFSLLRNGTCTYEVNNVSDKYQHVVERKKIILRIICLSAQ